MVKKKENTSANLSKRLNRLETAELDLTIFFEFLSNVKEDLSLKSIVNLTVLTLMGRLKFKNAMVVYDDFELVKGKKQKDYLIEKTIKSGEYEIEFFLGGVDEKISFSERDILFLNSILKLFSLIVENISSIERLRDTNRVLSKKILQFESLFETSSELIMIPDIEKAARVCMNIIVGSVGIKSIGLFLQVDGKKMVFGRNFKQDSKKLKKMKKIEVKYITLYLGDKINGREIEQSDMDFVHIILNLLYTNVENFKMIKQLIEKERLEREISIARQIQQRLLPSVLPEVEGIDIETGMITYYEVGGDYFDVLKIGNSLLIVIADVSGKGVPASLIMSAVQSSIRTMVLNGFDNLSEMVSNLNNLLISITESNKFVAMTLIVIRPNGKIEYLNAGHTPPVLISKDKVFRLEEGGPVVGLLDFARYKSFSRALKSGDCIFMYTDGISEATDRDGREFGEERIVDYLLSHRFEKNFSEKFMNYLKNFSNNNFNDDVTFVFIKKR